VREVKVHYILILPSKPKEIGKVDHFLRRVNRKARLNEDQYNRLLVATTEAVNNSIIHGNKRDPKKNVTVTCIVDGSSLIVRVHDEGPGFDALTLPDPLAEENLLREHGRGVFLMRSLMGKVEFEPHATGSDVVMTMALD
jgi:serine/threonine-protein kinase RsbW